MPDDLRRQLLGSQQLGSDVRLVLGSQQFGGWKTARVTVTMEAGAGSFDFTVSERWSYAPERREMRVGEACRVLIGEDLLITGYIDEVTRTLDATSHAVQVRGRDRVADLIDCAPNICAPGTIGPVQLGVAAGQWTNISLLELARELAEPFGIAVNADASVAAAVAKRFELVAMNPGSHVFELIEQQCRYRQVLPISDGRGGLLLTQASTARAATPLVEGQNILTASATLSGQDRFSSYIVKGQSYDLGTQGEQACFGEGYAADAEISRHRPLLITADQATDPNKCQERARWEALTRAARGARLHLTVQGWRQPNGSLWPVNALASVHSPSLGVTGDFLITQVSYNLPTVVTELELVRPDAFLTAPAEIPPTQIGHDEDAGSA